MTPKRLLLLVLVVALGGNACARHKLRADEIERNHLFSDLLKRSDQRTLGNDNFFERNLSEDMDPEVQEWCATALGRIGDPRSLPMLYAKLHSWSARVRAAAAFAVGEIENRERITEDGRPVDPRAPAELRILLDDGSDDVQMRAIEALGKIGGAAEAAEIVQRVLIFRYRNDPAGRAWLDSAITALFRLQDSSAIPVLETLATINDPEIQWRALNALIRLQVKAPARSLYLRLLKSPNQDVQAYAAHGVGICQDPLLAEALIPLLSPRTDSGQTIPLKVRIKALQALGTMRSATSIAAIARALDADPIDETHPDQISFSIQAAEALGNIGDVGGEVVLKPLLHGPSVVALPALLALAKVLRGDPERFYALDSPLNGLSGTRAWVNALGEMRNSRSQNELKQMLERALTETTRSPSGFSVPEILASLGRSQAPDLHIIVAPFLASRDGPTLRTALEAYRPSPSTKGAWRPLVSSYTGFADSRDSATKAALVKRLEPWIHEAEVQAMLREALRDKERNVRIAAARLLIRAGAAGVPDDPGPAEIRLTDLTYNLIAANRRDRTLAVLETERGDIEIELFRDAAPLTVANFISLARGRFYDGLSFTQVMPFFAVQGGGPRDDQEGGPGYSIRCEINTHPFGRGALGMARSGKDTGGSRFFITLAAQPHLDGAYTNFGRVISGMQVVDRLVPGDRIKTIEIKEEVTLIDSRHY